MGHIVNMMCCIESSNGCCVVLRDIYQDSTPGKKLVKNLDLDKEGKILNIMDINGGGGGSRTRVRKYSTVVSTYVASDLNSHRRAPKGRIDPTLSCKGFASIPPGEEDQLSCLNDALI